jgi:hypothetical protein
MAAARRASSSAPSSLGCQGGSLKLRYVYLEVTLLNGQNYSIPVEEGHSVEVELDLFLSRDGRYAGDWIPLQKANRQLFVRYEQIVLVSPTD